MMLADRRTATDLARVAAKSESSNLTVLRRVDAAPPVAFLRTLERVGGDLVILLSEGSNVVGRSKKLFGAWPAPFAVETSQWSIECTAGEARIRDAYSTNLSVLIPGDAVPARTLEGFGLLGLERLPNAVALPNANSPGGLRWNPLREGDVLRNCYATFVFGWLAAPAA